MAEVEIETFRLRDPATVAAFLSLDAALQEWSYRNRPGLIRRTVARSDDGGFLVITLASAPADTPAATRESPENDAWLALIEPASYETRRYRTLE